jgi:hypothetical protein
LVEQYRPKITNEGLVHGARGRSCRSC